MNFDIQAQLENDKVILIPLQEQDFEDLFAVAADPKIWEQHPNQDRWKKEVFKSFFDGAIQSKGAFKIVEKAHGQIIGCSRYYEFNALEDAIKIGYTFYKTAYWGKGYNHSVKKLMLDYIFQYVSTVYFHVGANNIRSQVAIGRLGAIKMGKEGIAYFGESPKLNLVYCLTREGWRSKNLN